jgi:hypothetical protein
MSEQLVSFWNFEFGVRLSHHGFSHANAGQDKKKKAVTPNERPVGSLSQNCTISDARLAPACGTREEEEDRGRS